MAPVVAPRGATDDAIVFATAAPETGLQRIRGVRAASRHGADAAGRVTVARAITCDPQILPGGQTVLFTITAVSGDMDASQIAVVDLP